MPTKTENKAVQLTSDIAPVQLMMKALETGISENGLTKLEKMLEIQERYEKNEAKKAYVKAMAEFKANPPKIYKNKTVGYQPANKPKVSYSHADLGNITEQISKAFGEHGLSAAWKIDQSQNITITCVITHELGHSESTSLTASADNTGSKNAIQAIASTITYLERYTLLALTGLATHDQDDDARKGGAAPIQCITKKQISTLTDLVHDLSDQNSEKNFLEYMKVKDITSIPISRFKYAQSALLQKKKVEDKSDSN